MLVNFYEVTDLIVRYLIKTFDRYFTNEANCFTKSLG